MRVSKKLDEFLKSPELFMIIDAKQANTVRTYLYGKYKEYKDKIKISQKGDIAIIRKIS